MAIVLKEITVAAFEIFGPVGRGAPNDPDDMATIKQLLNGISSVQAGAANTLNEKDFSTTDADFRRMVEAIEIFQARHFKGIFPPDGVVSPNKKTHNKLRDLFLAERNRKGSVLDLPVAVRPAGPMTGKSNETGFSLEGLRKGANGEWDSRDPNPTPLQMVPTGETRQLLLTLPAGSDIDKADLSTQILDPHIASLVGSSDTSATILGGTPGTTTLRISAKGRTKDIRIMVRGPRHMSLHLTVLGNIMGPGEEATLRSSIVDQLNRIYRPQANFVFFEGVARVVTSVKSKQQNAMVNITPTAQVLVDDTNSLSPSAAFPLVLWGQDLLAIDPSARQQFQIFIGNIIDPQGSSIVGSAFSENVNNVMGQRAAWFRLDQIGRRANNSFSTIAHESGHAMGMFHITASNNQRFLMFPNAVPQDNNLIIPAETTIDLGAP